MKFVKGDILDLDAKYLVASGNPWLNMSGGVNGALRDRYGDELQSELHDHLRELKQRNVAPGYCYKFKRKIGNYAGVIYGVAIDVWYESSIENVQKTLANSIKLLNPPSDDRIALTALATGYGKLSKMDCGKALKLFQEQNENLLQLIVVVRNEDDLDQIMTGFFR